jgi:hypothetical protein
VRAKVEADRGKAMAPAPLEPANVVISIAPLASVLNETEAARR